MKIRIALASILIIALSAFQNVTVVDGDTIHIDGIKYRIHGIDAPETRQTCKRANEDWQCGRAATIEMQRMISGQLVKCEGIEKDRYGRTVAKCFVNGMDLGRELVRKGLAMAYRYYSMDYAEDEVTAKANRLGVWGTEFLEPYQWRKRNR